MFDMAEYRFPSACRWVFPAWRYSTSVFVTAAPTFHLQSNQRIVSLNLKYFLCFFWDDDLSPFPDFNRPKYVAAFWHFHNRVLHTYTYRVPLI